MRTLYIVRHADTCPPGEYEDDHDRELTERGRQQARALRTVLSGTNQAPDCVLTSSAVRARQTGEILLSIDGAPSRSSLRTSRRLYRVEPTMVLEVASSADASVRNLLMVGHEPTCSTFVSRMVGAARVSMPVGTAVRIDLGPGDWEDVEFRNGVLRWVVPPSLLLTDR